MCTSSAPCVGRYNLPEGVVVSVPVTFADGKWSVLFDGSLGHELHERLQLSASEIRQVRYENNQGCCTTDIFISPHMCCYCIKKVLKVIFSFLGKRTWIRLKEYKYG